MRATLRRFRLLKVLQIRGRAASETEGETESASKNEELSSSLRRGGHVYTILYEPSI